MSFTYTPVLSEEEAQKAREFPLLPDGIYDFTVIESKFKYSTNGNPMIEMKLRITHGRTEFNVFDNLIGTPNMIFKTKHFCEGTGLKVQYESGQFNEKLALGRRGTCQIINVAAKPKNNGTNEMYKARNEVVDYVSPDSLTQATAQQRQQARAQQPNTFASPATTVPPAPEDDKFFDDNIPF